MATAKAKIDVFEAWLAKRCVRDGNAATEQRALFDDYREFAAGAPMRDQAFATAMERAGFRVLKREDGRYRQGVRLKVAFMGEAEPRAGVTREQVAIGARTKPETTAGAIARVADDVDEIEVTITLPPGSMLYKDTALDEPSPLVWDLRSAPYQGGPATFSIAMDCPDSTDVTPAKIASELYVEARRVRQPIDAGGEDLTVADDDALPAGELARMGAAYAFAASIPAKWKSWLTLSGKPPRDHEGAPVIGILRMLWLRGAELWKPATPRRMLVKAGALIVHAIARIDREEARKVQEQGRG